MTPHLTLVSHHLCPYVQRAAIALAEKQVPFERRTVELSDKPEWFTSISPLGKVPLLIAGDHVIFESAVILEYLEETEPLPLHPADPARRAEHRSWIEFGSAILNDIAGFYSARDAKGFDVKRQSLANRFSWVEARLCGGPWFDGETFSLVDAVYGPIFRYFDAFGKIGDFGIFEDTPKAREWRSNLAARPSVAGAVAPDYPARLMDFLVARNSYLSGLIQKSPGDRPLNRALRSGSIR